MSTLPLFHEGDLLQRLPYDSTQREISERYHFRFSCVEQKGNLLVHAHTSDCVTKTTFLRRDLA